MREEQLREEQLREEQQIAEERTQPETPFEQPFLRKRMDALPQVSPRSWSIAAS